VDLLLKFRHHSFFSYRSSLKFVDVHSIDAPSMVLSLDRRWRHARLQRAVGLKTHPFDVLNVNVHRFEEVINGREFKIEVSAVAPDKWRAQLARLPGGSAATMPFYGKTPHEAAGQLSRWLYLAHGNPRRQL
jgi:hypothetical protein